MNKTLKYLSAILLVSTLSACGGGGGGGSAPTPTNPPTNAAPVISVVSSASLDENTEKTLQLTVTDDVGTPNVSATTTVSGLSVSVSGNSLILKAGEVLKDETGTVTISAVDSVTSNTVTKNIAVTIINDITKNTDPIISVVSSASLEENTEKTLQLTVADDIGTPSVSASTTVSGLSVSVTGNSLVLKAGEVSKNESGTVTVSAVDSVTSKTVTRDIAVTVNNIIEVEVIKDGSPISGSIIVDTTNVAKVSLKEKNGTELTLSGATSSDLNIATVTFSGKVAEVKALRDGEVTVTLSTVVDSKTISKSFNAKVTGNKVPSIELSQFNIQMVEGTQNTVTVTFYDEDNTATAAGLSVSSTAPTVATATLLDRTITINGLTTGKGRIAVKLEDTPHVITTYIDVDVTEAGLPTIVLNRNQKIEMTEDETVEFDIDIVGAKASDYVPSVKVVEQVGELSDITYKVEGKKLIVTTKMLPVLGNYFNTLYTVKVSATNGTKTINATDVDLLVFKKMNATPIFEYSNVSGSFILVKPVGETRITVTINDDAPENVQLTKMEDWIPADAPGSYTIEILDTDKPELKTLLIKTNGMERNKTFGSLMSYRDGQFGGKIGLKFRTYEFSEFDKEVINYANVIAAKVEAVKEYVQIGKFYAEVLENDGVLTSLEADNYVDLLITDDINYSRFETVEYYIAMAFEMALNDEFNKDPKLVSTMKVSLDSLLTEVENEYGSKNIQLINEMASKSSDTLPELTYENKVQVYEDVYYSKFVGNTKYGQYEGSTWKFKPEYSFLNATKLRVQDKAKARVK